MNEVNTLPDGTYKGVLYLDINDYDCQIQYVNGKYIPNEGKENYPVIEVPWFDAKAFCKFYGGRLPTEAEWEFTHSPCEILLRSSGFATISQGKGCPKDSPIGTPLELRRG